jgi:hypothetical protein
MPCRFSDKYKFRQNCYRYLLALRKKAENVSQTLSRTYRTTGRHFPPYLSQQSGRRKGLK